MIYIEDYLDAVEFLEEAIYGKCEFSHSELAQIATPRSWNKVNLLLREILTYGNYRKKKIANDIIYSNLPKSSSKMPMEFISIPELESFQRLWQSQLNSCDPQEQAYFEDFTDHIEILKKDRFKSI